MTFNARLGLWAVIAFWLLGSSAADARTKSLQELATQADEIIIGKVEDKKVRVIGGRFETEYQIAVEEQWKGSKLEPGKKASVTLIGGSITSPPLTQVATGQPYMFVGEEVALFLDTKPRALSPEAIESLKGKSTLGSTPWVVGSRQGKFTVITDKKDNKKKITRVSLESFGVLHDDAILKRTADAVAEHKLTVRTGQVVASELAAEPNRDPLEVTKQARAKVLKRDAEQGLSELQKAQQGNPIIIQDFAEFKNQVLNLTGNAQ